MNRAVPFVFLIYFKVILIHSGSVNSALVDDYFANQKKFRPCAKLEFQTANHDTNIPVGYTFFKNATVNSEFKAVHVEDNCNLKICEDGVFQANCLPLGIDKNFISTTNTSLLCSCPILIPDLKDEFNRSHTGVIFSPYVKNWFQNAKHQPYKLAKWKDYTIDEIKDLLGIVAKSFNHISTYGMGATAPYVSWSQGDSSGLVPVAAAELNRELKAQGERAISITQGIWYGSAQYPDIFAQEINNAFEASENANEIYPGTVTGLIFTSHHVSDNQTAKAVYEILDAHRNRTHRLGLKVGVRLDICHRIIGEKLPEDTNQLHGVPSNYTYSEFKNPDLEFIFKNLVSRVDFIICHYDTPTSLAYQPMSNVVETMGADFVEIRRILHTIKPNLTVIAQTGWPSWGNSNNASPNNASNLVLYWNQLNDWAIREDFQLYMFEAFDEPWKNDLTLVDNSGPKGPAGAEGFYGWWRRYDSNDTLTYIPKIQDVMPSNSESDASLGLEVIFIAMAIIIVVVLGIIIALGWRLQKARTNIYTRSTHELAKDFRYGSKVSEEPEPDSDCELINGRDESQVIALRFPYNRKYELPRNKFTYEETCVLGEGNSGIVYKGYIVGLPDPVAFKTLKAEASVTDLKNLLSEIKIMSYVGQHEFIVNLLGAHTAKIEQGEVYVAAEFCEYGSLESYLKAQRGNYSSGKATAPIKPVSNGYVVAAFQPEVEAYIVPSTAITQADLLKWSYQIAAGLEHISLKKVIHADVACRNVLISSDGTAKLTDFGLSRQLYYKTQYLKSNSREKLPWRWMAVESLRSAQFSIQSDVWSFGITLWEIFSLIQLPYPGVVEWGEAFLLKLEEENYRMLPPANSTPQLNELMQRCWMREPSERPSFTELKESLNELYQKSQFNNPKMNTSG